MRVLVSGSDGFTGRYVCAALIDAGHAVIPLDADVTDRTAVRAAVAGARPEAVVHLAANAFVQSDDFTGFYTVNQIGTMYLLEALADHAPGIVAILAGSANIYGNLSGMLDEAAAVVPVNHYAASKAAMEIGARIFADRLRIRITRPFNYTGVGQEERYLIAKIVAHFRRGDAVIELGNLDIARDFGDVRSVAQAYLGLLTSDDDGVFNICTGEVHTLRDVIALASGITGRGIEVRVNPAFVRANDVMTLAGDPTRLKTALPGWRPVPLRDTLAWMLGATT